MRYRLLALGLIATLPTPTLAQAITANFTPASSSSGASSGAFPVTNTVNTGSNRLLVLMLTMETSNANAGNMDITSVTRGGQALTLLPNTSVSQTGGTNSNRSSIWYLFSPNQDSTAVTINTQGATVRTTAAAFAFNNVQQNTGIFGASSTATGTNNVSTSITSAATGSWVLDIGTLGVSANPLTATGTNHTEYTALENDTTMSAAFGRRELVPPGAITLGWQTTSGATPADARFLHSLVAFTPVPEPATVLAVAAVGLAGWRRWRR